MADLVSNTGAIVVGALALLSVKWYFSEPNVRLRVLSEGIAAFVSPGHHRTNHDRIPFRLSVALSDTNCRILESYTVIHHRGPIHLQRTEADSGGI